MSAMYDGLRVMFVEDDPAVRAATAQTLDLAGFEVEQHASAESALKNLKEYFPGVLLVDFQLTGMNGIALLERAVTIDRSLPVIIVTGHGDISIAVKAMHAGAYDFLEKPVSNDLLVGVVTRAMEKRRLTFEVSDLRGASSRRLASIVCLSVTLWPWSRCATASSSYPMSRRTS